MHAQDELDEKLRLERRKVGPLPYPSLPSSYSQLEMHLAREEAAEASRVHHKRNHVMANIQKETVREKLEETEREIEEVAGHAWRSS